MSRRSAGFVWLAAEVALRRRNCYVVRAMGLEMGKFSKIVRRLGRSQLGFVCLEFEVAGCYTETDEVFVGELDVIVTLAHWGWLRFGDEFCFFGCG